LATFKIAVYTAFFDGFSTNCSSCYTAFHQTFLTTQNENLLFGHALIQPGRNVIKIITLFHDACRHSAVLPQQKLSLESFFKSVYDDLGAWSITTKQKHHDSQWKLCFCVRFTSDPPLAGRSFAVTFQRWAI